MDTVRPVYSRTGISKKGLGITAAVFLLSWAVGKGIFENILVGDKTLQSAESMDFATFSIALQSLSTAAIPILVFFLVSRVKKEKNAPKFIVRIFLLALLIEIPYNLVFSGKILDFEGQNPAFAIVLSCIVLRTFEKYEKNIIGIIIKIATAAAAFFWTAALSVQWGGCILILCITMYIFWKSESIRLFMSAIALAICSIFSPLYMLAPTSLILLGFYKE